MAKEKDANEAPEPNPGDLGPGAAVDETSESGLGVQRGYWAPGTAHSAPAADVHESAEPSEHSYWPILVAVSVLVIGIGFLSNLAIAAVGAILLMMMLVGWFREPWVS